MKRDKKMKTSQKTLVMISAILYSMAFLAVVNASAVKKDDSLKNTVSFIMKKGWLLDIVIVYLI